MYVSKLHHNQIAHFNIKLENILIDRYNILYLIDFEQSHLFKNDTCIRDSTAYSFDNAKLLDIQSVENCLIEMHQSFDYTSLEVEFFKTIFNSMDQLIIHYQKYILGALFNRNIK